MFVGFGGADQREMSEEGRLSRASSTSSRSSTSDDGDNCAETVKKWKTDYKALYRDERRRARQHRHTSDSGGGGDLTQETYGPEVGDSLPRTDNRRRRPPAGGGGDGGGGGDDGEHPLKTFNPCNLFGNAPPARKKMDFSWRVKRGFEQEVYIHKSVCDLKVFDLPDSTTRMIAWFNNLIGLFAKIDLSDQALITKWLRNTEQPVGTMRSC